MNSETRLALMYQGYTDELLDDLVEREFSETCAWIDGNNRIQVETYTPRSASCG